MNTAVSYFDIADVARLLQSAIKGERGSYLDPKVDDTTCVILASSLLERTFLILLVAHFPRTLSKNDAINLFEGAGPLSSFSNRALVSRALALADTDTIHDLKIIRGIRNKFSHSPIKLELKDFQACHSLRLGKNRHFESRSEERTKFIKSCAECARRMIRGSVLKVCERQVLRKHKSEVETRYKDYIDSAESLDL
jgi:hypothetical protein